MTTKVLIHVMLKTGVLDPQGKAIGQALHGMGFDEVGTVRQGKVIELELNGEADQKRLADDGSWHRRPSRQQLGLQPKPRFLFRRMDIC